MVVMGEKKSTVTVCNNVFERFSAANMRLQQSELNESSGHLPELRSSLDSVSLLSCSGGIETKKRENVNLICLINPQKRLNKVHFLHRRNVDFVFHSLH